eukprot:PhM_4_TR11809/c0_g1_i1/m.4448
MVGFVAGVYVAAYAMASVAPYFVVRGARPVNYLHPDADDVRDIPLESDALNFEEAATIDEPMEVPYSAKNENETTAESHNNFGGGDVEGEDHDREQQQRDGGDALPHDDNTDIDDIHPSNVVAWDEVDV